MSVGFVPTMGALHEGHLALVREAKGRADRVVASVFVNPAQFAAHEDLDKYPRQPEQDGALLAGAGCDLMFQPDVAEMYPEGFATKVLVGGPAEGLETDFRPHFFAGVATVVAKLFAMAGRCRAYFGEKDFQQLAVVRQLAAGLGIGLMLLHERVVRPWQTLANMLAALREGDYSLRARGSGRDPMGLAYLEANMLAMSLRAQRLGAVEAEALLRTVMQEIDVAVFAFDENDRLALVNRAGAMLLAGNVDGLLGRSAAQLGLEGALHEDHPRVRDHVFPGGEGRWETRLHPFRQDGR